MRSWVQGAYSMSAHEMLWQHALEVTVSLQQPCINIGSWVK